MCSRPHRYERIDKLADVTQSCADSLESGLHRARVPGAIAGRCRWQGELLNPDSAPYHKVEAVWGWFGSDQTRLERNQPPHYPLDGNSVGVGNANTAL